MENKFIHQSRAIIEIKGLDRKKFLQGLITNDVEKASASNLIYSVMLNSQGRFLYDFFIFEIGESLILDCFKPRREEILQKLNFYKLRSKVQIVKNDELLVAQALEENNLPNAFLDPRNKNLGYRVYFYCHIDSSNFRSQFADCPPNSLDFHPNSSDSYPNPSDCHPNPSDCHPNPSNCHPNPSDSYPNPSDCHPNPSDSYPNPSDCHPNPSDCHPREGGDPESSTLTLNPSLRGDDNLTIKYNFLRILHKIPESEFDLTYEKSFILEFGFDNLNAIDYQKGCYVGQELTARTHYRGEIRKKLLHITIDNLQKIEKGQEISCEGKSVGIVLSSVFHDNKLHALALMKLENPDTEIQNLELEKNKITVIG